MVDAKMWRLANWKNPHGDLCWDYTKRRQITNEQWGKITAFEDGADAMHLADVEYLEGHKELVNLIEEGKVKITFGFTKEEWLAFTGREVV